jgi:hypothetical protein
MNYTLMQDQGPKGAVHLFRLIGCLRDVPCAENRHLKAYAFEGFWLVPISGD